MRRAARRRASVSPINGNGFMGAWRKVGIITGALIGLSAVTTPPIAAVWYFATRPIIEKVSELGDKQARADSLMRREIVRLGIVGTSNRTLILMLSEMNRYPIGSRERETLWKEIQKLDRSTAGKLEP